MKKILSIAFVTALITSCTFLAEQIENISSNNSKNEKSEVPSDDATTVLKSYYEDGKTIKKEITVKNGKKNGPAKEYYVTGELRTLVHYIDSKKHGETIWYYRNGQAYRVTPYAKGKMDGIRKKFYENGKLQAEIPYKNGELQEGTKEYNQKGELIQHKAEIIIRTRDHLEINNKYKINTYLSQDNYTKIQYYKEGINTEGNISRVKMDTYEGVGLAEFFIPKGTSKMESIKFLAQFSTNLGNPVLIAKEYRLNVSNN